jgi:3',5'-nucleoside bisphosphate phosphatase
MIDLHSHTTASDGQHEPEALLALAARAGVTVLAVTDHDTVGGLLACEAAARSRGIRLVPGIEISVNLNRREVHILGHFVDPTEPRLSAFAARLKAEREGRMQRMIDALVAMGIPVTLAQVRELAGEGAHLARPHLARVLVEMGLCASTRDAFDRFLGDGKPAAAPHLQLQPSEAIAIIHGAGGTATVAHPGVSKVERFELEALRALGLDGLEVVHPDHVPSLREKFVRWADALGLLCTAGSDFHGEAVAPGRHLGTVGMEPSIFAALEARAIARRGAAPTA